MHTYYAVIDTNVLVSALLRKSSIPGMVIDFAIAGRIIPLISDEIIAEYKDVLTRNKFDFKQEEINDLLRLFIKKGISLERTTTDECFPDSDDIVFYEIALSGRSTMNAFLVTGNLRHYPAQHFVVTPREMIQIIEGHDPEL